MLRFKSVSSRRQPKLCEAQFILGAVYTSGEGVPRNYAEALKWYRLAADQNFAEAQFNLGLMYAQGGVVPPDNVLAHMWLNLSAAQGLKQAETSRDRVQRLMTPAQIAEAQKLAREWKPTR
jgi:TPR repeat protein